MNFEYEVHGEEAGRKQINAIKKKVPQIDNVIDLLQLYSDFFKYTCKLSDNKLIISLVITEYDLLLDVFDFSHSEWLYDLSVFEHSLHDVLRDILSDSSCVDLLKCEINMSLEWKRDTYRPLHQVTLEFTDSSRKFIRTSVSSVSSIV